MRVTEQASHYANLEEMPTRELLENMNREDHKVPAVVASCIPNIEKLVEGIVERIKKGGKVFYPSPLKRNLSRGMTWIIRL